MSEQIEGRNAVLEAFRSGKCVDKLFVLDRCQDGPVRTIIREARKKDTIINFVQKERLDQLSETGAHQGVIAQVAAYEYSTVEDILEKAMEKGRLLLFSCWMTLRIPQPGRHHPYSQPCRSSRGDHPQKTRSRTDLHGCQDICRCPELHSGCQGFQPWTDH